MAKAGEYNLRVTILPVVLTKNTANNEDVPSWPGPGSDYFAKRLALNAGETIAQGVRQSTGAMKLSIRGRAITVSTQDRLVKKATGEVFEIVGVFRDSEDTILACDRAQEQTTGQ